MDYPTDIDSYRTVKIVQVSTETPRVKTFTFQDELCNDAKAGQYVMCWIHGVDEIPFSLSAINRKGLSSVAVEKVGEATAALHLKEVGDFISVRGPYGSPFTLVKGRTLVVGGGVGLAPLLPLLDELARAASQITLIVGAKTKDELLSLTRVKQVMENVEGELVITTEDGSYGVPGLATDPLKRLLAGKPFDMVYMCGPEPMMRRVFDLAEARGVAAQACFERIIRCSVGLCGSCVLGKLRICKEGPILSSSQMRKILDEFGVFKRDFDGKRLHF